MIRNSLFVSLAILIAGLVLFGSAMNNKNKTSNVRPVESKKEDPFDKPYWDHLGRTKKPNTDSLNGEILRIFMRIDTSSELQEIPSDTLVKFANLHREVYGIKDTNTMCSVDFTKKLYWINSVEGVIVSSYKDASWQDQDWRFIAALASQGQVSVGVKYESILDPNPVESWNLIKTYLRLLDGSSPCANVALSKKEYQNAVKTFVSHSSNAETIKSASELSEQDYDLGIKQKRGLNKEDVLGTFYVIRDKCPNK